MADSVISLGAKLLENAGSPAVDRRMSLMQSETDVIRVVIEDAEKRQVSDPAVKKWLESIKDVYYDVIDVLEELKLQDEKKVRLLGLPLSLSNPFRQRMAHNKMQGIVDEFKGLLSDRDKLELRRSWEQPQSSMVIGRQQKEAAHSGVDDVPHMYGRSDEMDAVFNKLFYNVHEGRHIQYLSVVGVAGVGKTLLAQRVYNGADLRGLIDLWAWVVVSEEFNLFRIAEAMLQSLTSTRVHEVELESLFLKIRQIIAGKTYLVVLDDVWNEDRSKWEQLKQLFSYGALGSTILITTRSESVAGAVGSTYIQRLNVLSERDCWSIIGDLAFDASIDERHREMFFNEVGRDFVKQSGGLPLIARSIGGVLRGRTSIQEWREVLRSYVWYSAEDWKDPFMLSYAMMPSVLRQCLMYCSIFPKNHYIDVQKLIKLWMAQGFVASEQDEMERQGWRYFKQLLDRSIFQEFKQDDNGDFKCKLEGGVSDFIQFLAQNECYIMLLDYTELGESHVPTKPRHCTLNVAPQASLPASIACAEKLHTLMIMSEYSSTDPTTLTSLLSRMRRLRALDLSSCSIKELPLKVGELLHLRYLDLSFNHDLKKLPQVICNLLNLQTLNLNGCDSLRKLPKDIGKLTKLRHLEILWTTSLSYLPEGIASLTSLRTLSRFFGSSGVGSKACNLGSLEKLNYLQGCITIDGLGGETGVSEAEKACLKIKKDLLGLELWFSIIGSETSDHDVLKALEAPPNLQCLGIFYYRGMLFPNWITAHEKLRSLKLVDCSKCEILPPLGKLPSLESLELKNMSNVKKVDSEFLGIGLENANGSKEGSSSTVAFPRLKKLRIQMFDNWEEWVGINDNEGHANIMPSLSSLSIVSCAKIKAVPNYIKRKENLSTDFRNSTLLEKNAKDDK